MRDRIDGLPVRESMKRSHRVRRFRRSNAEHGRTFIHYQQKPWKAHRPVRSAA